MDLVLRDATRYWAFGLGLALRLALLVLVVPRTQETWFLPFLESFLVQPSIDPWGTFLAAGGSAKAFPYGPMMLLAFLPLTGSAWVLGLPFGLESAGAALGLKLTLLAADLAALFFLLKLAPERPRLVVVFYWLSPIVLFVTYWHGQVDIIPVALTVGALALVAQLRTITAGAIFGIAVGAKLSMLIILPFILIYFYQNKRIRPLASRFVASFAMLGAIGTGVPVLSSGFTEMVIGTPEAEKLFWLAMPQSENLAIFIVPLVYLFLVYATWRLRRTNFELSLNMAGLSFMIVVLLTPASPGWYLWVLPFLVIFQINTDMTGRLAVSVFSLLIVALLVVVSSGAAIPITGFGWNTAMSPETMGRAYSLWNTAIVALGLVIAFRMYRHGIQNNDYFQISRRPVAIGISGDSGTGKDTLGGALEGLFGKQSVTHIYGDGYHKWGRGAPMWRAITHLDPRANDLHQLASDSIDLIDGKSIVVQRYNHSTGRFSRPVVLSSNEVICVTGLHTLLPPALADRLDVRLFLDTDRNLKHYWKVQRDVIHRGHNRDKVLESIRRREPDVERFITPQADRADVVFSLSPVNESHLEDNLAPDYIPLKLYVLIRNGFYHERLKKVLIALCGVQLDSHLCENGRDVEMSIQGDVWKEDIGLAAGVLVPHLEELLDAEPEWEPDMLGLMQLIVLMHANEKLKQRLAK